MFQNRTHKLISMCSHSSKEETKEDTFASKLHCRDSVLLDDLNSKNELFQNEEITVDLKSTFFEEPSTSSAGPSNSLAEPSISVVASTGELYQQFSEEESLFSSDGQEEYQPHLSDLSSSDEDRSFVRQVKEEIKKKSRKRQRQFSSDEDVILGTDSDTDRPSFFFQRRGRKNDTSKCLNTSNNIDALPDESNSEFQIEVREDAREEQVSNEIVDISCWDIQSQLFDKERGENLVDGRSNGSRLMNDSAENVIEPKVKKIKTFNLPEKQSRKRCSNPHTWKKNEAKLAREQGKCYVSQKGVTVGEKMVNEGYLCNEKCRYKCNENFSIEDRKEILSSFYKLDINSKNNLLFKSVVPVNKQRSKQNVTKNRGQSYEFHVRKNNQEIRVCKKALCSLFQIGKKKIELLQDKMKDGISAAPPDRRGCHTSRPNKISNEVIGYIHQHIKSFPAESSHYSRNVNRFKKYLSSLLDVPKMHKLYIDLCELEEKPEQFRVKVSFYRAVFDKDFNLSFGHPRSDTCSTCDAGENTEEHQESYKEAFALQKIDREKAKTTEKVCYITVDLQQTMPLPRLTTSKAFYLRQLWFYNLGVHIISKDVEKTDFGTWTEDVANRGSSEVASALLTLCELDTALRNSDHLIIWSDSCSGQNKNFLLVLLYQYMICKEMFTIIDHKFPEVGHSYLDSDRDFGRIEKELRKQENVYVPDQYREIISKSGKKNFVVDMYSHFRDFENFAERLDLKQNKKDLLEENVRFRDGIKWIRVEEYGSYLFKETYDEFTPFKKVSLLKQDKKGTISKSRKVNGPQKESVRVWKPFSIKRKGNPYGTVSKEKIQNLKTQMKFVKPEHQWFYEGVIRNQEEKFNVTGKENENDKRKVTKKKSGKP